MIAALALWHGVPVLENDRDYEAIARHFDLTRC
jgi:predicted nucleic acid-binding protein